MAFDFEAASPTEKLEMEIDATFSSEMSQVDEALLAMKAPSSPFLEKKTFQRRGSRKMSIRHKKKDSEASEPYSIRKNSLRRQKTVTDT